MDPPGFGEVRHLGSNAFQARIIRVFSPEEREGDGPVPLSPTASSTAAFDAGWIYPEVLAASPFFSSTGNPRTQKYPKLALR